MANDTRYYYNYHFPLRVAETVISMIAAGAGADAQISSGQVDPASRVWYSQPRTAQDYSADGQTTTSPTEAAIVIFRLPVLISDISMEILRTPCVMEVWYQDRANNWRPVLNLQRVPLRVAVSRSDVKSYYKYSSACYPTVAKKFQIRLTRTFDQELANTPYSVGVRNCLLRRNVYDRTQGSHPFEDEIDVLGNVITKYIKDWDASQAVDDNPTTFWKSAAQPDPAAVVSLYLDVRSETGGPKTIDKVYIDPVYSGQNLNLYYSSDDTVGTRKLSPITLPPSVDENTNWRSGRGRSDIAGLSSESIYRWPISVGPLIDQDAWIGVEWTPDFDPGAGPPQNPVLWRTVADVGEAFVPSFYYDVGAGEFILKFLNDSDAQVFSIPITHTWSPGDTLRVVAGWSYTTQTVSIKAVTQSGTEIVNYTGSTSDLPSVVTMDGEMEMFCFRGTVSNLIVKLEDYEATSAAFLNSPTYYVDPDPVIPDSDGSIPSTSLDNAIYAAAFLTREHGQGGTHDTHFENKEWTPVWRDYLCQKGLLFLPQPTSMKYLKVEFSNLTEEPYPISDVGISVSYQIYPISTIVNLTSGLRGTTGANGFLGLGTFVSSTGPRTINWFHPDTIARAIGSVVGSAIPAIQVNTAAPFITSTLPNQGGQQASNVSRYEYANPYVYPRDGSQVTVLSSNQYYSIINTNSLQGLTNTTDVPWNAIAQTNPGVVTHIRSTGTVPIRGTDWWVYPGQQLKVPAAVMRRLTATQTVTERKLAIEPRIRFNTVGVHRYERRTLVRDAAIAYFAGVREIQPYASTFVAGEDRDSFDFPHYDPDLWNFSDNVVQVSSGPISVDPNSTESATIYKSLQTQSSFAKVKVDFRDSGLVRSDSMWADIVPDSQSIDDTRLAPYVRMIPEGMLGGMWGDTNYAWADTGTMWGSPYGTVSVNVAGDRRYQGKRVLHFRRAAGAGEAGVRVRQWTNFAPLGLSRIGCVFYKPTANTNTATLRLRRIKDGVFVHEEVITAPSGRWFEYTTQFVEVPAGELTALDNTTFDTDLSDWTVEGDGVWIRDTDGRTAQGSAKLVASDSHDALVSDPIDVVPGTRVNCSCWLKWLDLTMTDLLYPAPVDFPGSILPGHQAIEPIRLTARFYNGTTLVSEHDLGVVTSPGVSHDWMKLSGGVTVPDAGVTHVAFAATVSRGVASGSQIWFDDFIPDVPGSNGQSYEVSLTLSGDEEDEVYLSDLYCEIAGARYFLRLGSVGSYLHEVTDLRYSSGSATVTTTNPVSEIGVQVAILSPKTWIFGANIRPSYLK